MEIAGSCRYEQRHPLNGVVELLENITKITKICKENGKQNITNFNVNIPCVWPTTP